MAQGLNLHCESCILGKMTRSKFKRHPAHERSRAEEVMDVWNIDTCGPITPLSLQGHRHILLVVDNKSNFVQGGFLVRRSEVLEVLSVLKERSEAQHDRRLKILISDNAVNLPQKNSQLGVERMV